MFTIDIAERDGFPFPFWCSPLAALCSLSKTEHAPAYYIIIDCTDNYISQMNSRGPASNIYSRAKRRVSSKPT
ncbi:hypothetical protein ACN38_g9357 [Penicillium nordicum]|uniref:Uncharacterized protein n=1 Tax=Penicillium nordicum TaxID=229535 RepID=A0A0M8NVR3_9EURO|nr:hypothetical protein ACN38_g9357 [Penicillium nordicum]